MKSIILVLSLFSLSIWTGTGASADYSLPVSSDNWKLVINDGNLKVYKRTPKDSPFKEVKATTIIQAQMEDVVEALSDVDKYPEWVYKCKEGKIVKRISDSKFIYYNHSDLPSPIWDRDMVVVTEQWYDETSRSISTFSTIAEGDYVPLKKNVVRVERFESRWVFKDLGDGHTGIKYEMFLDPGGSVPAWLVNMAVAKGPVRTMKALEKRIR